MFWVNEISWYLDWTQWTGTKWLPFYRRNTNAFIWRKNFWGSPNISLNKGPIHVCIYYIYTSFGHYEFRTDIPIILKHPPVVDAYVTGPTYSPIGQRSCQSARKKSAIVTLSVQPVHIRTGIMIHRSVRSQTTHTLLTCCHVWHLRNAWCTTLAGCVPDNVSE